MWWQRTPPPPLPPAVGLCSPNPRLESHQKNAVEEEIPQCVMTLHFRLVLRNKKSGVGRWRWYGHSWDPMTALTSCFPGADHLFPWSSVSSLRNQSTSPLTQITEKPEN